MSMGHGLPRSMSDYSQRMGLFQLRLVRATGINDGYELSRGVGALDNTLLRLCS